MKNSNFWYFTLCALLVTASVDGWNTPLSIAATANALVVLLDVAKKATKSLYLEEKNENHH